MGIRFMSSQYGRLPINFIASSLVLVNLLFACPTGAIELNRIILDGGYQIIRVRGSIVRNDAQQFFDFTANVQRATISLEGPGGSVTESLEIGAEIRSRNFATMVAPTAQCYSACALIWISGSRRYLSDSSKIGFHAAYISRDGRNIETGMGNAEIGSFLTHIGLRIEAIRFVTAAAPEKLNILSPDLARALSIEVYETVGLSTITPQQQPTASALADRAVRLLAIKGRCAPFVNLDPSLLEEKAREAAGRGRDLAGGELFGRLLIEYLDTSKSEIARVGPLAWCHDSEAIVRSLGLSGH